MSRGCVTRERDVAVVESPCCHCKRHVGAVARDIGEHVRIIAPNGKPAKDVNDVLAGLPGRQRTVLRMRYGLCAGTPATLEAIGIRLGVTKERARQIEASALAKLKGQATVWSWAAQRVRMALSATDGIAGPDRLLRQLSKGSSDDIAPPEFLLRLIPRLDPEVIEMRIGKTRVWALRSSPLDLISRVQAFCISMLRESKIGLSFDLVVSKVLGEMGSSGLNRGFAAAVIRECKQIKVSEDTWLFDASRRSGPDLRKIVSVLKEAGVPLHFTVIRGKLNGSKEQESSLRAVQAMLGRNPDLFVRTARGVFGLREWGMDKAMCRSGGQLTACARCEALAHSGSP